MWSADPHLVETKLEAGRVAVERARRQREFWQSGFHPVAWLKCLFAHGSHRFYEHRDGRLIRAACGTCSRPYRGFIRLGRWSLGWLRDDVYTPLSERYGTTKTWRVGRWTLRRHGRLNPTERNEG